METLRLDLSNKRTYLPAILGQQSYEMLHGYLTGSGPIEAVIDKCKYTVQSSIRNVSKTQRPVYFKTVNITKTRPGDQDNQIMCVLMHDEHIDIRMHFVRANNRQFDFMLILQYLHRAMFYGAYGTGIQDALTFGLTSTCMPRLIACIDKFAGSLRYQPVKLCVITLYETPQEFSYHYLVRRQEQMEKCLHECKQILGALKLTDMEWQDLFEHLAVRFGLSNSQLDVLADCFVSVSEISDMVAQLMTEITHKTFSTVLHRYLTRIVEKIYTTFYPVQIQNNENENHGDIVAAEVLYAECNEYCQNLQLLVTLTELAYF